MALIEYRDALNQAFAEEIERDPNVVLIGEEARSMMALTRSPEGFGSDLATSASWTPRSARRHSSAWEWERRCWACGP